MDSINLELPNKPPSKRGCWQFTLKLLIGMATLMAVLLALPRLMLDARIREKRLGERLRCAHCSVLPPVDLGRASAYPVGRILDHWYPGIGSIYVQPHHDFRLWKLPSGLKDAYRLQEIHLFWRGTAGPALAELEGLSSVRTVRLQSDCITERQICCLEKCPNLERLDVSGGRVDDETLACLAKITQLRTLILTGQGFTERGLAQMASLVNLRWLYINCDTRCASSVVTDATLANFANIPRLERLDLVHTRIKGSGFCHLMKLKLLRTLIVTMPEPDKDGRDAIKSITWVQSVDIRTTKP